MSQMSNVEKIRKTNKFKRLSAVTRRKSKKQADLQRRQQRAGKLHIHELYLEEN
jgi:hypothetical protein